MTINFKNTAEVWFISHWLTLVHEVSTCFLVHFDNYKLHSNMDIMAKLKAYISRKPIPPFFFGSHNLFQFILCTFFSSLICPHQYFAIIELISLQRFFGSLKRLIEYVDMTCAMDLMRTSLPAFEMVFSFHPVTRLVLWTYSPCSFLPPLASLSIS